MMRSASNWAWSHCSCSFHKLNAATSDRLFAFRVLSWASHMKSSTHCPLICRAEMDTTHGHHNWTCGCDNWNLLQIVYGIDKLHDQSSKKALNATWVGRPKTHQGMANNATTLDHNDELYYYDLLWYWCIPRCMYVYIIYCAYTLFHLILEKPWTWILKIIYFLPPFSSQASNTKGIRSHEKSCPARIIDPRSWSKVLNPADGDFWDWILYPPKNPQNASQFGSQSQLENATGFWENTSQFPIYPANQSHWKCQIQLKKMIPHLVIHHIATGSWENPSQFDSQIPRRNMIPFFGFVS